MDDQRILLRHLELTFYQRSLSYSSSCSFHVIKTAELSPAFSPDVGVTSSQDASQISSHPVELAAALQTQFVSAFPPINCNLFKKIHLQKILSNLCIGVAMSDGVFEEGALEVEKKTVSNCLPVHLSM
jgi:hypothetical protein